MPLNLKERKAEMEKWRKEAQRRLKALSPEERAYLEERIVALRRKSSKRLAAGIVEEISEILGMPDPLDFCLQWKWEGVGGIDYVLSRTIYPLA